MDVHPPLAKLLITLAGWLAGFKGNFDFKEIGKDYLEPGVPYVAMRMLPAILGVLTVPIMFLTLKATGCRTPTAVLGAGAILFGKPSSTAQNCNCLLIPHREWPSHPVSLYSLGFSPRVLYSAYRSLIHLFHESTGARAITRLSRTLVVLVGSHWPEFRCYAEYKMGWPLYSRLGWFPHHPSTLGGSW
jgi:hypothetical protein